MNNHQSINIGRLIKFCHLNITNKWISLQLQKQTWFKNAVYLTGLATYVRENITDNGVLRKMCRPKIFRYPDRAGPKWNLKTREPEAREKFFKSRCSTISCISLTFRNCKYSWRQVKKYKPDPKNILKAREPEARDKFFGLGRV